MHELVLNLVSNVFGITVLGGHEKKIDAAHDSPRGLSLLELNHLS